MQEPIELRHWVWWRWPWRAAIILKARDCSMGTLRGRQLRRARENVLRDIHLRLPEIEPTLMGGSDDSLEEEWVRRWDEMLLSLGDDDKWDSLWRKAMAQGRGLAFAVRERRYRDQAAETVRDRAGTLLYRLGAHAKAILRQPPYRVTGYRVEAGTGRVEKNKTILTAYDFAVFSVDLSSGCLIAPEAGLKYVAVTVCEIPISTPNGRGDGSLTEGESTQPLLDEQQNDARVPAKVAEFLMPDVAIEKLTSKSPIPASIVKKYLEELKAKGGPIPAKNTVADQIRKDFLNYRVPRNRVREIHREVFGSQPPGPRKNDSFDNSAE